MRVFLNWDNHTLKVVAFDGSILSEASQLGLGQNEILLKGFDIIKLLFGSNG